LRYKIFRFAVLVPHRDIRPALRSFRSRLFAAGIWGVYTFPPVVPLALLERPLGESELKALASSLRALSLEAGSGVFTAAGSPVLITGPREGGLFGLSFWGLPLNIPVPSLPDMTGALPPLSPGGPLRRPCRNTARRRAGNSPNSGYLSGKAAGPALPRRSRGKSHH
jgi:hypothetical protein